MSKLILSVATDSLPFRAPFRITGYTFTVSRVVVVRISDGQASGLGEASGIYYRSEDVEAMVASIEAVRPALEAGVSREELRALMPAGGARNAVDCALWDLQAKQERRPVWQLAKLNPPVPLLTTYTLGAESPQFMAQAAQNATSFSALKLKLAGELDLDIERVSSVRAARPDAWLSVDANQGYSIDVLTNLLPCLTRAKVELIEQPLARGRESDLDGFKCPIPIAADESVLGLDEMPALVGRFGVVNIKLDKCGGLTEALLMIDAARRMGLRLMVGNMVGSSWAMAPGYLVGQSCEFVDLDGPLALAVDRVPGVCYEDGHVRCDESVWGAATQNTGVGT
jgi:L-alanine-DL-glutamate epimerase-like enolase superfamily enzyme